MPPEPRVPLRQVTQTGGVAVAAAQGCVWRDLPARSWPALITLVPPAPRPDCPPAALLLPTPPHPLHALAHAPPRRLLDAGSGLAPLPAAARTASNRVMGCTAQVWLAAETDAAGRMAFQVGRAGGREAAVGAVGRRRGEAGGGGGELHGGSVCK